MSNGAIYCNRCGSQNSALAKFCANCGTPFSPDLQPPAPATPEVSLPPQGPAWQPPPLTYATPAARGQYGGFWLRFVAAFIDGILVGMVVLPFSLMMTFAIGLAGRGVNMPGIGINLVSIVVRFVFGALVKWIYEALMESSSRQATVGKIALGLKVTDLEGKRISFSRASGRVFGKYISAMIFFIGYIMAGFTERKQALHDMIAGTLVVRAQ